MSERLASSFLCAIALTFALAASATAQRDPPRQTRTEVAGVRVRGESVISSVAPPREPRFVLRNTTTEPRTVELDQLTSLGQGRRRVLTIRSPRTITLPPGASRTILVSFRGDALPSAAGLTYHRFALTVRVGTETADAISSVGYSCRMPLH